MDTHQLSLTKLRAVIRGAKAHLAKKIKPEPKPLTQANPRALQKRFQEMIEEQEIQGIKPNWGRPLRDSLQAALGDNSVISRLRGFLSDADDVLSTWSLHPIASQQQSHSPD